ncbi:MAG: sulfurtransferase [Bryobacterales bacterium]|jgi:rhodanese-related sulfurtransferase|nr:sulfurtransferase [Bryobacterales bacterium]
MIHSAGFLKLVSDAKTRIEEMTVEEYLELSSNGHSHVLIDTREESEWAAGRAAGAVHLSKGVIERDIEAKIPDKDVTLVLYCGGGYRSALAADALRQMGYRRPVSLAGGWRAIVAAGLPVE